MTDVAADQLTADWVGCLVLAIAPEPYMNHVTEAVSLAEVTIFRDPVLVDR